MGEKGDVMHKFTLPGAKKSSLSPDNPDAPSSSQHHFKKEWMSKPSLRLPDALPDIIPM